jgi:hypothetical protein
MTGCAALHGSLNIRESIKNKNEMVSFYWVDVEIGRGPGLSLHPVSQILGEFRDGLERRFPICISPHHQSASIPF